MTSKPKILVYLSPELLERVERLCHSEGGKRRYGLRNTLIETAVERYISSVEKITLEAKGETPDE